MAKKKSGREKAEKSLSLSGVKTLADLDKTINYLRTDVFQMNDNFGGLPRKAIIHVGAKEGAGKTTALSQAGISALKYLPKEYKLLFLDFENKVNKKMMSIMCEYFDISEERFLLIQPLSGQDGLMEIEKAFTNEYIPVIIVDSVKAIVSKKAIEKDIDENAPAMAGPKLMNEFLEKNINNFPEHLTLILIDHLKESSSSGSFFTSNETKSGASVKFYSSLRIFIGRDKKGIIKKEEDGVTKIIGHHIYMDVKKSSVCPMAKLNNIPFYNGRGISVSSYLFKKAIRYGIVKLFSEVKAKKGEKEARKEGYYYLRGKEEIYIGKSKPACQKWISINKEYIQEINDIVYTKGQEEFHKTMNGEYIFYQSEFGF